MSDFIKNYGPVILFLIVIIATIVVLLHSKYKAQVKQCLLALVIEAEKKYGGKTGDVKFSDVAKSVWGMLPPFAKMIISARLIGELINIAVQEMKIYLQNNTAAATLIQPDVIQAVPITIEAAPSVPAAYTIRMPEANK